MKGLVCVTIASLALSCGVENNNSDSLDHAVDFISCADVAQQLREMNDSRIKSASTVNSCNIRPLTETGYSLCEASKTLSEVSDHMYSDFLMDYEEHCVSDDVGADYCLLNLDSE